MPLDSTPSLEITALPTDGATALTHYARITLTRPSQHNRIDPDDVPVLMAHLNTVTQHPQLLALVITGCGEKTFSSGYTLQAIVEKLDHQFEDFLNTLEQFPLPTVCALNGSVYGGATDLALCCDFRIGIEGMRMFIPAAQIGLHYYPDGVRRYVQQLGAPAAKKLLLTAQTIEAPEMLRIGFLHELCARADFGNQVEQYLYALARCEPNVVRSMKQHIHALLNHTLNDSPVSTNAFDINTPDNTTMPKNHARAWFETSLRSETLKKRLSKK